MRAPSPLCLLFSLFVAVACGDSGVNPNDPDDPDDPNPEFPDPEPDPDSDVMCEYLGYHCSIADVPDEVLERGDDLLEEIRDRFDGGSSPAAIEAWLKAQSGVREVGRVESGLVFILHGGIPMFFMTPDADGPAPSSPTAPRFMGDVVGHDTDRDNDEKKKKALILSPFLFELGADPGEAVENMLEGTRDYRQQVVRIGNHGQPAVGAGHPTPEDFLGWGDYDFVLVHTHGAEYADNPNLCQRLDPYFCVSGIMTGRRVTGCTQAKASYSAYDGITCGRTSGAEGSFVVLQTEFFHDAYGSLIGSSGLDKAIVILSACHSSANGSLAAALAGSNSEFFGWNNLADNPAAVSGVTRLVELMVKDGLRTPEAYQKLRSENGDIAGLADLEHRGHGRGLHIREITTLKNPISGSAAPAPGRAAGGVPGRAPGDEELTGGDVIPFVGQAGDGENDELFLFVDIDGVESGKEGEFELQIKLDDEELGSWSLEGEHARRIDDTTVRIRVYQPLDFDIQPDQTATLEALTKLGDEAESPHKVEVKFENPILHVRSTITTSGGDAEFESEVEAEVKLAFKRGEDPDYLEFGESEGELDYLRFDVTLPSPGCTVTTVTVPGRLGVADGEIDFTDPESPDFGVPEELVLVVYPEIKETIIIQCPQGSTSFGTIHWFAGFVSFHGGQLGGPNELDESKGGFVITQWTPGDEMVYASREYQRTGQEDEVTLTEDTTLEIRGPRYGPSAASDPVYGGRRR